MDGISIASRALKRATTCDMSMKYTESLISYQEGISLLVKATTDIGDCVLKIKLRKKIEEYIQRAEKIKSHIQKMKRMQPFRDQIKINNDDTGFSYEMIFARFLDSNLHGIEIDDAYILSPHQCDNFMHFVEICIKHAPNLKTIVLKTGLDDGENGNVGAQKERLSTIKCSALQASNGNVCVDIVYSNMGHDREIRFDNGIVIKIGRGLDFYKQTDRYTAGWIDYTFRKCRETTVDIFYNNEIDKCK